MLSSAQGILADVLRPHSYDHFFDQVFGREPVAFHDDTAAEFRANILGADPAQTILQAYEKFAPTLTCHAKTPTVKPPDARAVGSADAFKALIGRYHKHGYTVRIPDVVDLTPELLRVSRALEVVLENPVGAVIFWSDAGAEAPVHYDDIDVFVLQLSGRKRWFISKEPPKLPNKWKGIGEAPPALGQHWTFDVKPGDMIYMPRGSAHTVQSTTESIHISIGFVPVTVREAILAALDHLSDLDRPLRAGVVDRADNLARGAGGDEVSAQVNAGLQKLVSNCRSDAFVKNAMEKRRSRMIVDLAKIPTSAPTAPTTLQSRVKHSPFAIQNIIKTPTVIDLSLPGEQLLLHPGAESSLQFIVTHPRVYRCRYSWRVRQRCSHRFGRSPNCQWFSGDRLATA